MSGAFNASIGHEQDAEARRSGNRRFGRRRPGGFLPFQFQIPLGGGAPGLAIPFGGYGAPLAFTIPLGGSAPPAPSTVAVPVVPAAVAVPVRAPTAGDAPVVVAAADAPLYEPPADADGETAHGRDETALLGQHLLSAAEAAGCSGGTGLRSSSAFLESLIGDGLAAVHGDLLRPPRAGERAASASVLFHALVDLRHRRRRDALHRRYADRFAILAHPGEPMSNIVPLPGDLLVRVALGEGWGWLAVVASRGLHAHTRLAERGFRCEGHPRVARGAYVHVVEPGGRFRSREARFARRLSDAGGIVLPDTLLLRLQPIGLWSAASEAGPGDGAPEPPDASGLLRQGESGRAVWALQRQLNRVYADLIALGLAGLRGCPLPENGRFGAPMAHAVLAFQQQVFSDPAQWDGAVGPATRARLDLLAGAAEFSEEEERTATAESLPAEDHDQNALAGLEETDVGERERTEPAERSVRQGDLSDRGRFADHEFWDTAATFEFEEAGCTGDHEFLDLEGDLLEAEIWQGTAEQIAFRDRVLGAHVAQSRRRAGAAKRDLSRAELGAVASTDGVEMGLDAAAAAGRLLAAANADLARAQASGHADALRTERLSATSGYRGSAHQRDLWLQYFAAKDGYYDQTQTARERLADGPHSAQAVTYMLTPVRAGGFGLGGRIAAPGYSNHQGGIAIDFWQVRRKGHEIRNSSRDAARARWRATGFYDWLRANAASFGFQPIATEEWHWEYRPGAGATVVASATPATDRAPVGPTASHAAAKDVDGDPTMIAVGGPPPSREALLPLQSEAGWAEAAPPSPVVVHPLVRVGSRGAAVREAQQKLNRVHMNQLAARSPGLAAAPLIEDGIFGSRTRETTMSFQQLAFPDNPREWDGTIGPKTWLQLDRFADAPVPRPRVPAPPPPIPPQSSIVPVVSRDTVVPVIVLPGVMGTRLRFPPAVNLPDWDPDSGLTMLKWFGASGADKLTGLNVASPAMIIVDSGDANRHRRGWDQIADRHYSPLLLGIENALNTVDPFHRTLGFPILRCPAWVFGYDWRQSNAIHATALEAMVSRVCEIERAEQVILVTHSMGGLVARWAIAMRTGLSARIKGVIHVVQPSCGAVVAARRFRTGFTTGIDGSLGEAIEDLLAESEGLGESEDGTFDEGAEIKDFVQTRLFQALHSDSIIAASPEFYNRLMSVLAGPNELLPSDAAPKKWWPPLAREPLGSSVYEVYARSWHRGGLIHPNLVLRADGIMLQQRFADARAFHEAIGGRYHPVTGVIFSTGLTTDTTLDPEGRPKEGDGTVPAFSARCPDLQAPCFVASFDRVEHATCYQNKALLETVLDGIHLIARGGSAAGSRPPPRRPTFAVPPGLLKI
jgi:peptidoglycan hydrolase-like protein with peptidoglycan-binding domain